LPAVGQNWPFGLISERGRDGNHADLRGGAWKVSNFCCSMRPAFTE
jgi:hypothetical protein